MTTTATATGTEGPNSPGEAMSVGPAEDAQDAFGEPEPLTTEQRLALLEQREMQLRQKHTEVLRASQAAIARSPLNHFVPTPKQYDFIAAAGTPRRGVFAGNRWGKSTIGTIEDICFAIGERPFFPKGHPLRTQGIPQTRGQKILILCENWEKANEIFTENQLDEERQGKFWQFLDLDWVKSTSRNRQNGVIDRIFIERKYLGATRSSVIAFATVRSYLNSPLSAESSSWDVIHVDEPVPEEMWRAHSRGLIDSEGVAWFLLTSLDEPWIYNWFVSNENNENFWLTTADTDENSTLSRKAIEQYFASLTPEEQDARRKGIPRIFSKMVYITHVDQQLQIVDKPSTWPGSEDPPPEYTIRYALDLHPQTPHAVLFAATSPFGVTYFYKELYEHCSIPRLAEQVLRHVEGRFCVTPICDPIAWIVNPNTGLCWADDLHMCGLPVEKAPKNKTEGIAKTRDALGVRPPQIVFLKHMHRTIGELRSYHYDKENKPVDKDDHMMENMYRMVVTGLQYVVPDSSDETPVSDLDLNKFPGYALASAHSREF